MHVVQQGSHRAGDRVRHFLGHAICIKTHALFHYLAAGIVLRLLLHDNATRNTDNCCPGRDRLGYHGIRTDFGTLTHFERSQYLCACTYHDAVADRGVALTLAPARSTEGHTLIQRNVVTNNRCLTNNHTHTVVNEKAPANCGSRMYLDTGKPPRQRRNSARKPFEPGIPEPVRKPVDNQSMEPRVVCQHFKGIPGSRIPVKNAFYIFTQMPKHGHLPVRSVLNQPEFVSCFRTPPRLSAPRSGPPGEY